jgi:hypothetical protein
VDVGPDSNDEERILIGKLDNEPIVNTDLRLGMEISVSYDLIREHMKDASFKQ